MPPNPGNWIPFLPFVWLHQILTAASTFLWLSLFSSINFEHFIFEHFITAPILFSSCPMWEKAQKTDVCARFSNSASASFLNCICVTPVNHPDNEFPYWESPMVSRGHWCRQWRPHRGPSMDYCHLWGIFIWYQFDCILKYCASCHRFVTLRDIATSAANLL